MAAVRDAEKLRTSTCPFADRVAQASIAAYRKYTQDLKQEGQTVLAAILIHDAVRDVLQVRPPPSCQLPTALPRLSRGPLQGGCLAFSRPPSRGVPGFLAAPPARLLVGCTAGGAGTAHAGPWLCLLCAQPLGGAVATLAAMDII